MSNKKTFSEGDYNYLSHSTFLKADVECESIIIHGKMKGNVTAKYNVIVGKQAVVEGNIIAKQVIIFGRVLGNLKINSELQIKSSALINGDIEAGAMSVEMGAVLNGHCTSYNHEQNPFYLNELFSPKIKLENETKHPEVTLNLILNNNINSCTNLDSPINYWFDSFAVKKESDSSSLHVISKTETSTSFLSVLKRKLIMFSLKKKERINQPTVKRHTPQIEQLPETYSFW